MATDPDELAARRRPMSDKDFTEFCDELRDFYFSSPERSQRWKQLRERIETKGTGALTPTEFGEFSEFVTGIAKSLNEQGATERGKRIATFLERMQRQGARPKQRRVTPIDDHFMSLKVLLCRACGGTVRLDANTKLVYSKLAWRLQGRGNQDFPEQRLADDLGIDVDAVALATRKLERVGLITALRNRGKKRWNNYTVTPLEQIRHVGDLRFTLSAVFAADVEPSDEHVDAAPAPCNCAKKRVRGTAVHPNIQDAVHPTIPDAGIRTSRMPDPGISDAISNQRISNKTTKQTNVEAIASTRVGSLSQTDAGRRPGGTGDDERLTSVTAALQSDHSPNHPAAADADFDYDSVPF